MPMTHASNNSMKKSIYETLSRDTAAAADSLWVMLQKEQTTYDVSSCDYLLASSPLHPSATAGTSIGESDRVQIVDWCYSVVDICQFDREIVAIAMGMVDRFLSRPSSSGEIGYYTQDSEKFQLLAMTALYISIKTNERAAFNSSYFSIMSFGQYSVEDIEATEVKILFGLSWNICAPTSIQFANHILSLLLPHVILKETTWAILLDEVKYQAEYAVRDFYFSSQRPSTVAFAAIFNALEEVSISQDERQAVLRALMLIIINGALASPEILRGAMFRLHHLMEFDVEDDVSIEDGDVLCDTFEKTEIEECDGGGGASFYYVGADGEDLSESSRF